MSLYDKDGIKMADTSVHDDVIMGFQELESGNISGGGWVQLAMLLLTFKKAKNMNAVIYGNDGEEKQKDVKANIWCRQVSRDHTKQNDETRWREYSRPSFRH